MVSDYHFINGVPLGIEIKMKVTPQQYADYLRSVVGDAMDQGFTAGRSRDTPKLVQQKWMATCLNAAGYISTKWERMLQDD